jgi:hypothetical protein
LGALLCFACGSDGEIERQGTPACQDFQRAVCDFAVDECGYGDRGSCDRDLAAVECTSDDLATRCSNQLNTATCGQPAPDCDFLRIIDREAALSGCTRLATTLCQQLVACGQAASTQACQAELASVGFDCARAIGVSPRLDDCVQQVDETVCSAVPTACKDVVRLLPADVPGAFP